MSQLDTSNLHVLLVDDDRHFRTLLRYILTSMGIRTIVDVSNAYQAFEACKSNEFNIAYVDLHMPELTGLEFANIVRTSEDSPNPRLPLVLVTGDARMSTVKAAINAGFEGMLAKPIRPVDVINKTKKILESPFPYVRAKDYYGPCRRRALDLNYVGPKRRANEAFQGDGYGEDLLDLSTIKVVHRRSTAA